MRLPQAHVATAIAALWLAASPARCAEATPPVVRAVLFSSPTCPHCNAVRQQVLPALAARYGSQFQVVVLSTTTPSGHLLFSAACDRYWIGRRAVPLLVVGDVPLMGSDEIPRRLPGLVATHLAKGGVDWPDIPGLRDVLAASADAEPAPEPAAPPAAPPAAEPVAEPFPPAAEPADAGADPAPPAQGVGRVAPHRALPASPGGSPADAASQAAAAPSLPAPASVEQPPSEGHVGGAPSATRASGVIDLTGESESSGTMARLRRDPHGNGLAVLVLAGMVLTLLVSAATLRRATPAAPATTPRFDWLTPILALAGLGVAAYLAHVEVRQVEAVCGPVGDCNTVQQSEYARLFGLLPIGALGVLGFAAILAAWALRRWGSRRVSVWAAMGILAMAGFGTLFSIYLTFLEPFVIGATCLWCLSSAVIMTTLYVLALGPGRGAMALLRRTDRPRF